MLVVDTCIVVDIADDDPEFGIASAHCLAANLKNGLAVSPITYIELAPMFAGSARLLEEFLNGLGVEFDTVFDAVDKSTAFSAWARHISSRRAGKSKRRPVADALIGAMAIRHDGIITRNGDDFLSFYPDLSVVEP